MATDVYDDTAAPAAGTAALAAPPRGAPPKGVSESASESPPRYATMPVADLLACKPPKSGTPESIAYVLALWRVDELTTVQQKRVRVAIGKALAPIKSSLKHKHQGKGWTAWVQTHFKGIRSERSLDKYIAASRVFTDEEINDPDKSWSRLLVIYGLDRLASEKPIYHAKPESETRSADQKAALPAPPPETEPESKPQPQTTRMSALLVRLSGQVLSDLANQVRELLNGAEKLQGDESALENEPLLRIMREKVRNQIGNLQETEKQLSGLIGSITPPELTAAPRGIDLSDIV